MSRVSLTVNGARVEATVEPRTHLADFLRDQCNLTGTHLGCEHGVCGACTVLLDDVPVRSCITYAIACQDKSVRTVEGFGNDPAMERLRQAFTREHALQCGFCTPGMLIAAYDIVHRLPTADEARVRTELAGNICRCTGYMGIVAAIRSVMAEDAPAQVATAPTKASLPGPLPRFAVAASEDAGPVAPVSAAAASAEPLAPGWTRVADSFRVDRPPAEVWALFADVARMAGAMPGARLEQYDGHTLRGRFEARMGPIRAAFAGKATIERDDARMIGRMSGGGEDGSASRAEGVVTYRLTPAGDGGSTTVAVTMDFHLQGALSQFGRSGIVRDVIRLTIADFSRNLAALASGAPPPAAGEPSLNMTRIVAATLWSRLTGWFGRLFGGSR
jgi:aerobic carbon-monoxide dehydrogenase small subunit